MIFEQALKFVSQSPENFAYHLVIFLCLQISVGLSYWLWRRSPEDKLAKRLLIGTGAILLVRLLWSAALILFVEDRVTLAPVERGFSLIAIAFLTWCLAPAWDEAARIRTASLVVITLGSFAGMYFAIPDWVGRINVEAYANTAQAPAWALGGIVLSLGCIITLSMMRPFDWILRLATVVPLFIALLLHFFAVSPSILTSIDLSPQIATGVVPVWDRFAWLLSTPLLVVIAFRRVMSYLLDQTGLTGKGRTRLATMLEQSVNLLESDKMVDRVENAAELFDGMYGVQFVGLASFSDEDQQYADLAIVQKDISGLNFEEPRRWMLNLADWPFILHSLEKKVAIQISPYDQTSTRNVYDLHQELHLRFLTPILAVPLSRGDQKIGFLLLGASPQQVNWAQEDREVVKRLGDHIARSLLDREKISRFEFAENGLGLIDDLEVTAKIDSLEEENRLLSIRLTELQKELKDASHQLSLAGQATQATDNQVVSETEELKQEVDVLRDALIEAEISLDNSESQVALNENIAPTLEQYSQTITRYSGELELAQQHIHELEYQLNRIHLGTLDTKLPSPSEEIRTPMALIQSYTDILLADGTGFLSVKQVDLLQRVKYSTGRVSYLLDRLDILWQEGVLSPIVSDLDTVFTQAITALGGPLGSRKIKLNLEMDDHYPSIRMEPATLNHLFSSVLSHIAGMALDGGSLNVILKINDMANELDEQDELLSETMQLLVFSADVNIAISPSETNEDENSQHIAQLSADGIYTIVKTHGGRIWTDTDPNTGSYRTTVLLPVLEIAEANSSQAVTQLESVPHVK